jgi:hypothetical protein
MIQAKGNAQHVQPVLFVDARIKAQFVVSPGSFIEASGKIVQLCLFMSAATLIGSERVRQLTWHSLSERIVSLSADDVSRCAARE